MPAERNVTIALAATTEALDAGLKDAEGKLKDFQKKASGGGGGKLGDPGNTLGFGKIADVMGKVVVYTKALEGGLTAVTAVSKLLRGDLEGADKAAEKIPLGIGAAYSAIKSAAGEVRQLALMWGGLDKVEAKALKTLEEYAEFTKQVAEKRKEKREAAPGLANQSLAESKKLGGQFGREAEIASYEGGPSQAIREAQLERDDRMKAARDRIKANPKDRRIVDSANTEMKQAAEDYRQTYYNIVRELAENERQANAETAHRRGIAMLEEIRKERDMIEQNRQIDIQNNQRQIAAREDIAGTKRETQILGMSPASAAATRAIDASRKRISDFAGKLEELPGGVRGNSRQLGEFIGAERLRLRAELEQQRKAGMPTPSNWQAGFRQVEGRMSTDSLISRMAGGVLPVRLEPRVVALLERMAGGFGKGPVPG